MARRSETPLKLIIALWAAGLCAAAQFAKISLIFPELIKLYPDAGAVGGFLVSLLSFLGVVLGLVAGIVVARFGYRILLLAALLFGALISAYQATLPAFSLMLASRFLEGASHLIIVVAAPTLIAQLSSDRHRAAAMTLWGTFFGVAFALVAWFGLPLVKTHGPASLFIAHSVAMFLVAGLLLVLLPHDNQQMQHENTPSFGEIARKHVETYRSAFVAAPAMGWLFYTLSFVSLLTVLPNHIVSEQRDFATGAMPLASIVSSMTLGVVLLRYLDPIQVVILGFFCALMCTISFWFYPGSVAGCIALFGALGLVQGASFASVPQLNMSSKPWAHANGALAQMGNLGNLIGTPVMLLITGFMNFQGLILFALACYLGGIVVHVMMAIRRRREFIQT
jgi:MFS transporter, DHA1 family, inner membrane transport protein